MTTMPALNAALKKLYMYKMCTALRTSVYCKCKIVFQVIELLKNNAILH